MGQSIFETNSFHDNYIHGVSYVDEEFSSDLIFDIDYIQEWFCSEVPCEFLIVPATLTFKMVSALVISITKPGYTLNSYLGIILEVTSEKLMDSRARYEIKMVDGNFIKLEAEGADLQVTGDPIKTKVQHLSSTERLTLIHRFRELSNQ